MGAAPPMDVAAYLKAKGYSAPASYAPPPMDPEKYLEEKTGKKPEPNPLMTALQWVGRQADRVSAAPLRGAQEELQNRLTGQKQGGPLDLETAGAMAFGPAYDIAKGAVRGLINPDAVQPAAKFYERLGVPNEPTPMRYNYPTGFDTRPMQPQYGQQGTADALGMAQDMAAPAPVLGAAGEGIAQGAKAAVSAGGKALKNAAEMSILEKFGNMGRMRKLAPTMGAGRELETAEEAAKAIDNAPKIVADKLREHDLLYSPAKANFNLQRDLRKYGSEIGSTVQEMKARDVSVNIRKVVDDYAASKVKALNESGKGVGSIEDFQTKILPKLQSMADAISDGAGNAPIDKAVAFRQDLQEMVKNWDRTAGSAPLAQRAAKELQYRTNQAIRVSDKQGARLAALNEKYGDLSDLRPLIEDAYTRGFGRAAVGRDVRPLPFTREGVVNRLAEYVGSPVRSVMSAKPDWAEALANRGNVPTGLNIQAAAPTVTAEELAALKQSFLTPPSEGLPPRQPTMRRALAPNAPAFVSMPNDAAPGLPPRQPINIRAPFAEKAPTFVPRADFDPNTLPPRIPMGTRRPLESKAPTFIQAAPSDALPPRVPGRRPLNPNDPSVALWELAKKAKTPKERKEIMDLIRKEQARRFEEQKTKSGTR